MHVVGGLSLQGWKPAWVRCGATALAQWRRLGGLRAACITASSRLAWLPWWLTQSPKIQPIRSIQRPVDLIPTPGGSSASRFPCQATVAVPWQEGCFPCQSVTTITFSLNPAVKTGQSFVLSAVQLIDSQMIGLETSGTAPKPSPGACSHNVHSVALWESRMSFEHPSLDLNQSQQHRLFPARARGLISLITSILGIVEVCISRRHRPA